MSAPPDDVEVLLRPLLRRLYARMRARGEPPESACDSAAVLAAELLACPVDRARTVMATVAVTGARRPV